VFNSEQRNAAPCVFLRGRRIRKVTDNREQSPPQETQDTQRRCPACGAFARVIQTVLDSRKGKIVYLFPVSMRQADVE
jgi:hypothetical protein